MPNLFLKLLSWMYVINIFKCYVNKTYIGVFVKNVIVPRWAVSLKPD